MQTSLEFLPRNKQAELNKVIEIIIKHIKVEMIILFGSYARSTWVEQGQLGKEQRWYQRYSDYDVLAVTDTSRRAAAVATWEKIEREIDYCSDIQTWVNIIVHDIHDVNQQLEQGQYFFSDIEKEGILIYHSGRFQLASKRQLTADEMQSRAKQYFDQWFSSAEAYYLQHVHAMEIDHYAIAIFDLHQAAERAYIAVLLVFTAYKPRFHSLEKLARRVAAIDKRLYAVFPRRNKQQRFMFNLLKKSYIDARYKMSYRVSRRQLDYFSKCVRELHDLVKSISQAHIERLGKPDNDSEQSPTVESVRSSPLSSLESR